MEQKTVCPVFKLCVEDSESESVCVSVGRAMAVFSRAKGLDSYLKKLKVCVIENES